MRLRRCKRSAEEEEKEKGWWRTKNRPQKWIWLSKLDGWSPIVKFKQIFTLTLIIGVLFIGIGTETRFSTTVSRDTHQNLRRFMDLNNAFQLAGDLNETEGCDEYMHEKIHELKNESSCLANEGRWEVDDDDLWSLIFAGLKEKKVIFGLIPSPVHKWLKHACYQKPYAPCGALANAMFNDTFKITNLAGDVVPMTSDDLLHYHEIKTLYQNPKTFGNQTLCDVFDKNTVKPKNWPKRACELDLNDPDNNGFQNFDFIVWMRRTVHGDFRKNYRRLYISANSAYKRGLPAGRYILVVENNYNVSGLKSKKYFIIKSSCWTISNSEVLGILYLVVGIMCLLSAVFLAVIHYLYGHTWVCLKLQQIATLPHYPDSY
ncbi:Protein of unknown function DUF284,transmembrane eukaryotic family-containing protein [Aphelenchoides bicaudatus]|nr:Protein of unknown function DUF284,transmembrane eukaryotic family-containing protein [Aphelenchoides bicaudatus]